jgi:hypothetical protein
MSRNNIIVKWAQEDAETSYNLLNKNNMSRNISHVKKPAKMPELDMWRLFHEKGQVKMQGRSRFCIYG